MNHDLAHIRIIGFCDVPGKPHGMGWNVMFAERDCFDAESVPTPDWLRKYAQQLGYYPSGKRGAHPAMCDPVYRYLPGTVHEHQIRPRGDGVAE